MSQTHNHMSRGEQAQNPSDAVRVPRYDLLMAASELIMSYRETIPSSDHASLSLLGNIAVLIRRCSTTAEMHRFVGLLGQMHWRLRSLPSDIEARIDYAAEAQRDADLAQMDWGFESANKAPIS